MNRTIRLLTLLTGLFLFVTTACGQLPVIKYTGATNLCDGKNLLLSVDGAAANATFKWRRDGAFIAPPQTQASYLVAVTGNYDVIVTTGAVHDTLDAVKVTVNPNPQSAFSISGGNSCSNIPIGFSNSSTGTALDYAWHFGDPNSTASNTSDVKNPVHTFIGSPGNATQAFTVRLIVTDNKGCADTISKGVTVKQVPGTQLGGTGATTYNGLPYFTQCNSVASPFTFTNQSGTKATNTGYQIKWGDAAADLSDPGFNATTHNYSVGTHQLRYIVSGGNGCKDTAIYNVFVGSNPAVGFGNPGNTIICSGTSLTFPVSNTSSNPPGTVYRLEINDGSAPISYNHPAPATVTHTFNKGSCGITSGSFNNSFSASIVASNPCGISAASVVPIYVSKKATADFKISPNDTTCVNSVVSFTNTGINANSVSALGECTPGRSVWTITPATGWTVSSGAVGDDFGLTDPSVWAAGSTTLDVNFTQPGIYKIKLKTGGTALCGNDEFEKTICVNPLPVAAFVTNTNAGCLPLTVTTTNNSNSPNCGANVYNWSVSYSNGSDCAPGVSDYDYINGTSSSSTAPQFRFNSPGVYTISLYLSNKSSSCISAVVKRQVTVRAKPTAILSVASSICAGGSVSPSASVNNCYGTGDAIYAWTFTGGSPASSANVSPGAIVYNAAGNFNVALSVSNECGSITVTKPVSVKSSPEVNVPSDKVICAGEMTGPLNFSSATPGANFSWTNSMPSIGLGPGGSGNIPSFMAKNSGTTAVVATINIRSNLNGCEGPVRSFTITVQPKPAAPLVNPPVQYCVGETAGALVATASAGHSLMWYTTATGGAGSVTTPVIVTSVPGSVSYYVSQVNTVTGCESVRSAALVTINPSPKISSSTFSSPATCAMSNGSITLNGLIPNTSYTVRYNKNSIAVSTTLVSNVSGVIVIGNLSSGTYSNIVVTLNGCVSNEAGPFTLTDPDPPAGATINSNSPVCAGSPINLTSSTTTVGASYIWNGPDHFSSDLQNPVINTAKLLSAGNYTVTITRNGCSVSKTVNVVVHPQPSKPVVEGPVQYCLNETASALDATASAGHTLTWYDNKELANGTTTTPVPVTSTAGNSFYYVTQTSAPGCVSDTAAIAVTVYSPVTGNTIGSDQTLCMGGTANLLTSINAPAGGNGSYQYQWQLSTDNGVNWTDITRAMFETYAPGIMTATTKFRRYTSSAPCVAELSNVVTITVQGTLSHYDITVSQKICPGTMPAPLIGEVPVGGSGAYTYEWESSPDNVNWTKINGAGLQNYQPPALTMTTYYRRKVNSGSCSAYSTVVTITVIAKPVMNPVTNVSYCTGSTGGNISFGSVPSTNISYTWVNDNPSIGLAASGSGGLPPFTTMNNLVIDGLRYPITAKITVTPAYDDGTIRCVGAPVQFTITVLPFVSPLQPLDIPLCSGSSVEQYSPISDARDVPGSSVSYDWTVEGNAIDLTDGTGTQLPPITGTNPGSTDAISTITIKAIYTLNGKICEGGSTSYRIIVKPAITDNNISADQNICEHTAAALLNGSIPAGGNGNYRYQWQSSINNGTTWGDITGATAINYDPGVLATTTQFRRQVKSSVCGVPAASNVVTIQVGADAKASFMATKDTGCAPFILDGAIVSVQSFSQNIAYNWYANGGFIGSSVNFPGYTIDNAHDSVTIKLVTTSGCKADSIERKFYTYRVPVPSFTLSADSGCGPLMVAVQNTTPDAALFNYQWDFGNGVVSDAVQPGNIVFAPNPTYGDTTYTVQLNVTSVCDVKVVSQPVLVKSKPKVLFAPSSTVGCSPMTVVFNNISAGVDNTYAWDFGDGSVLTGSSADTVTHTFTTAVRDTFYVKLKASNECGVDTLQYAIVVSPNTIQLDFAINGDEETGCAPHATRFINNTKGASSFTWDFGDGTTINTTKNIDTVLHRFALPGTYTVVLRATNGCSDTTSTETVTVYPSPLANFHIDARCLNDTVRFSNLTTTATSYQWDFGDGKFSTEKNPSHLFSEPGNYTVNLIAFQFNAPGSICSDTLTKMMQLGPVGTFDYSDIFLCNEGTAVFKVQGNADTLIFDFGDGEQVKTVNNTVSHSYANGGVYLPSVILKNKAGCEVMINGKDSIRVDKVSAGFHAVQQRSCGSTTVQFKDTSFAYFGKASVQWNFGDGTTGTGASFEHVYTVSGRYPIELIVTGHNGCTDTAREYLEVVVNTIPVASVSIDPVSCVGYVIPFTSLVQSTDPVNLYQWTISNGVSSQDASFPYTFNQAGNYNVQFIAGTVNGCYDTIIHNIKINPSPVVRTGSDQTICLGNTIRLNASGSDLLTWSPMEGLSCTECASPLAAPVVTTPYVVKGTNSFGCSAYDTVVVTVIQPLQLQVSADDSICIGSSSQLVASGASDYNWSPATGLNNATVSNPVATPSTTTRYRVVGYDGYFCFTDTAYVLVAVGDYPAINLGPDLTLASGTMQPLTSAVENGPVKLWNWTPSRDLSCSDCPLPIATIKKDISYTVSITNMYGCPAQDTINIKVFCENAQVFIANAFTPDGDGVNDVLFVQGTGIAQVKFWRIFNRWGEVVFERNNFSPNDRAYSWDGKVRGVAGGPDVYVYTAEVVCENGAVYTYKGNVSVLK